MSITIIQVVIILFALFALTRAILRLKDGIIKPMELTFWGILWILVIIIAVFPQVLSGFAWSIGIASGLNLLVYAGIILLFYMLFRLYVKVDKQGQEITELVRHSAIKKKK